jgi:hypothetical protein
MLGLRDEGSHDTGGYVGWGGGQQQSDSHFGYLTRPWAEGREPLAKGTL